MKTAIVTGASTGIGRATAVALSGEGYHVYIVARNLEGLQETEKQIADLGKGSATIAQVDLSKIDEVIQFIDEVRSKETELKATINIAGIWHGDGDVYAGLDFEKFDRQVIVDTYNVGFVAPTLLTHGLLPLMGEDARIVNLSGTFEDGGKGWLPYYASKRAIEDLTVGLAQELEDKKILVNCVSPSDTATEQYKKYFPAYAEDAIEPSKIADKIVELCESSDVGSGKVIVMRNGQEAVEQFHA